MSLDISLKLPTGAHHIDSEAIYIREDGQNKRITRAEWDVRYPDREPFVVSQDDDTEVYSANITHNLNKMASEAGIYEALWRPEEVGYKTAGQLIEPLRVGLALLESDAARFEQFNPENGWGSYAGLVRFVRDYLEACERYPTAEVSAWR